MLSNWTKTAAAAGLSACLACVFGCAMAKVEHPVVAQLGADDQDTQIEFWHTLATKPVNFENLRKNAKSISDLRLQRRTAVIDAFEKASNVLDDKQKQRLHEFIAE